MTTARRLLGLAAMLVLLWGALELAGGRDATCALAGAARDPSTLAFALAYLGAWFAAVLLAPPLVLTAGILAVGARIASTGARARLP
jgi:hypothetical protein